MARLPPLRPSGPCPPSAYNKIRPVRPRLPRRPPEVDRFAAGQLTAPFEVVVRRDGVWSAEHWTAEAWHAWLESASPRELARHILYWNALAAKMPERRADLAIASHGARTRLRASECRRGEPSL